MGQLQKIINEIKSDLNLGVYERMKYSKALELVDPLLESINQKIDSKTVTCNDFNQLISETTPESIRDRVRRRTLKGINKSHQDNETGHQSLTLPSINKRTMPKRKPIHQQNHGRGNLGHKHSAKTQEKTQKRIHEAIEYIKNQWDKDVVESYDDKSMLNRVINKLLSKPGIDRERLTRLM